MVHEPASALEYLPASQAMQLVRSELEYLPEAQGVLQSFTLAWFQPSPAVVRILPAGHNVHAVCPAAPTYLPVAQVEQEEDPVEGAIEPAAQSEQLAEPLEEDFPAAQERQSNAAS